MANLTLYTIPIKLLSNEIDSTDNIYKFYEDNIFFLS